MTDKESDNKKVLEILKQGPATALDIFRKIGTLNARSRISNLRDMGYDIDGPYVEYNGKHFKRYELQNQAQ
jgi:hypothetical protein